MKTTFTKSFAGDLKKRKNDLDLMERMKGVIHNVERAPTIGDIHNLKQLKGESGYYRIRTGHYRIGIKIENELVVFVRVLHLLPGKCLAHLRAVGYLRTRCP